MYNIDFWYVFSLNQSYDYVCHLLDYEFFEGKIMSYSFFWHQIKLLFAW